MLYQYIRGIATVFVIFLITGAVIFSLLINP